MPLTLSTPVTDQFRLTPPQRDALKRLGIKSIEDLLYHFPARYGDTAEARTIDSLQKGDSAVIFGKISGLKTAKGFHSKIAMAEGYVEDESGRIQCVWFNQPYVAKMYTDGMLVRIEGKVSARQKKSKIKVSEQLPIGEAQASYAGPQEEDVSETPRLYFSNPKIETVNKLPTGVGDSLFGSEGEGHTLYPVYPESRGISSAWLYHTIQKLFKSGLLDELVDPIPETILTKYSLPGLRSALIWIHGPKRRDDALSARKRFSFEELFVIQIGKQQSRKQYEKYPCFQIETKPEHVREFVRRFPFQATGAQVRAIDTILADMQGNRAMSRLLEGDVGSGKTAVAAATAYAVMTTRPSVLGPDGKPVKQNFGNLQIAYMCPTEILAIQHFESFIQFFSYMPIQIGLITGSGCRKFPSKVNPKGWTDISRTQLLSWVANGEVAVLIGTHTLIQKSVTFKNLAYAVIDEQHRFGTAQRGELVRKNSALGGIAPHLLSMTATPIPRTLALTMYGDLDLTLLDEIPAGRKPIITELVLPAGREETYEKIRQELVAGRQAYVICPRVNEPDPEKEAAIIAKSVKEEAKRLKTSIFQEYEIGVLHGRMKPAEKDHIMSDFRAGKIHILCATSVVEVGVNVPNATSIIIEGAERFGLSQLHQLRGRVMRSTHQAYCYAFTETTSAKSIERLRALQTAKNGFELAELDLAARGAGQLSGGRQWGVSDVAMEALQNLKMVEAARTEAAAIVKNDRKLAKYPELKKQVEMHASKVHFE